MNHLNGSGATPNIQTLIFSVANKLRKKKEKKKVIRSEVGMLSPMKATTVKQLPLFLVIVVIFYIVTEGLGW